MLRKYFPWPIEIFILQYNNTWVYILVNFIEKDKKIRLRVTIIFSNVMLQKILIFDIIMFLKHFILHLDI